MLHTLARTLHASVPLPRTSFRAEVLILSFVTAALGCQPELPSPSGEHGAAAAPSPASHGPEIRIEPEASLDAAPRVLRVRIVPAADVPVDPARLLFVRGHVSDALVREVEREAVSATLAKRAVPAIAWSDADGTAVIAPTEALDPGATYGVLSGDPPLGVDIQVASADSLPLLARTWPVPGAPDAGRFAVFCAANGPETELAEPVPRAELVPGHVGATVQRGIAGPIGTSCLRVDAGPEATGAGGADVTEDGGAGATGGVGATGGGGATGGAGATGSAGATGGNAQAPWFVPPALVSLADGSSVRLEPEPVARAPMLESASPREVVALACEPDQIAFGPGCARVSDDRLAIATPEVPLLWAVRSPAIGDVVRVTAPGQPWVLRGLRPAAFATFRLAAVDAAGRESHASLDVMTAPAAPRIILSEVLANPLGAEPDEEWVELFNDSSAPADLTGYVLQDGDGVTPLPAAQLAPGTYALVVNQPFVLDDGQDPAPASGALILRVPKLGKGGLKNSGEPLALIAPDGSVISRLPAAPKPKPGQSLARVTPESPDGDPASFEARKPTPGAPN